MRGKSMIIYLAGLSGTSNLKRLKVWFDNGLTNKLMSYYEVMIEEGAVEFDYLKRINKGEINVRKNSPDSRGISKGKK
jgi:hypothetical protein